MNAQKVEFDFLEQHFECQLFLKKINRHKTKIYQFHLTTTPICIVAHGKVSQKKDGKRVVSLDSPYSFGCFGGPIVKRLTQELQNLEL